jgi:hypothetical protein
MSSKEAILKARYEEAKRNGNTIAMMFALREIVAVKAALDAKKGGKQ